MLQPKRTKYRKMHKGRNDGLSWSANAVSFGEYGLRATATGQPYSGQHDFVKTEMLWPITHMVAPAKDAVACASCHSSAKTSRLGDLPGVYLPGRDRHPWIDTLGWLAVAGALAGVLVHAAARLVNRARHGKGH